MKHSLSRLNFLGWTHRSSLLGLICFLCFYSWAQPSICDDPAVMTPTCAAACIICDIDGYTGINNGGSIGEAPSDFCTKEVHNARWIAFMAGSTSLKLQLSVSNCNIGRGLELAIYKSTDCENFTMISNCLGSANAVGDGESAIFETTEPLVIGQYYYVVMDGSRADVCNWSFSVLEGSTKVSPLDVTNPIEGVSSNCPQSGNWYYTPPLSGAIDYDWTLNGSYIGSGDSIYIDWNTEGIFELCVKASNVCDEADEACKIISIAKLPATKLDTSVCDGDTLETSFGSKLFASGKYSELFTSSTGCDSTVEITLEILPHSSSTFEYNVCSNDSFYWNGIFYNEAGIYGTISTASNGCDSSVGLILNVIDCELAYEASQINPRCFNDKNGKIQFSISNGIPDFSYQWSKIGQDQRENGSINNLNQVIEIENLGASWYAFYISDNHGNDLAFQIQLIEPDSMEGKVILSDYYSYNISCFGNDDGTITVSGTGGSPRYAFLWSNGDTSSFRENLEAGIYNVTISDQMGCMNNLEIELTEPDSLRGDVLFVDPDCYDPNSGIIEVTSVSGGTSPYNFVLNDSYPSSNSVFTDLKEGEYTVSIFDRNDCFSDTTGDLRAPIIAEVTAFNDTSIFLGDTARLWVLSDIDLNKNNTVWTPKSRIECDTCIQTTVIPARSGYFVVSVTSSDNCVSSDSIYIEVTPRGRIYVPSAFTPNSDQLNSTFYVHGGSEIKRIKSFLILNRWGEIIFKSEDTAPHNPELGWDGTYKNKQVPQGVYVWVAEVEYIDDRQFTYKGTVTLLR